MKTLICRVRVYVHVLRRRGRTEPGLAITLLRAFRSARSATTMADNDLEEQVTCWVCFEVMEDPTTLACSHSFCKVRRSFLLILDVLNVR